MSDFPTHPEQTDARWLNEVLAGTDYLRSGGICDVSWEYIGTGQVGDSVRFQMGFADKSSATIAAKFPAVDPVSRGTAAMMGLYEKEVRFYAELAPHIDARIPQTYFAEVNEDGSEFMLLLEDLGPARGGDQIAGCDYADAQAAMRQAAALHAPSWDTPELIGHDWLHSSDELTAQIKVMYPQAQAVFRDRYANTLEPEYMDLCEQVAALPEQFQALANGPQCLVHGDFRLDNMLFDIKGGTQPLAILDWQTVRSGNAMTDIGYFLGAGIGNDLRESHEDALIDLYLNEMAARGVALSRADIWDNYRVGALHGLTTGVFSAAFVERTERGDANFLSMVRGACGLALTHNSLSALKDLLA